MVGDGFFEVLRRSTVKQQVSVRKCLQVQGAVLSDVGRKRTNNEDAYLLQSEQRLFAVADGMGGHAGGEVASALAVQTLRSAMDQIPDVAFTQVATVDNRRALLAWLSTTVEQVNQAIYARAEADQSLRGMGCTLDVALVRGNALFLAHVGDSRTYLLREGKLYRLTEDHSFGQMLLSQGALSPAEVAVHPRRHALTRALGPFSSTQVDTVFVELAPGDTVLMCSDGLYGEVPDELLQQTLAGQPIPQQAVAELIEQALQAGGKDNVTALVFHVDPTAERNQAVLGSQLVRAAMMQSDLFGSLAPGEILRIQKIAVAQEFEPDMAIIKPGDLVSSVYLVVVGQLSIWKAGVQIGRGDPGDPTGAVALSPRVAGELMRVEAPTIVLEFPLAELHTLFAAEPDLAAKVVLAALRRVSSRLHKLTDLVAQWRSAGLIPAFGAD